MSREKEFKTLFSHLFSFSIFILFYFFEWKNLLIKSFRGIIFFFFSFFEWKRENKKNSTRNLEIIEKKILFILFIINYIYLFSIKLYVKAFFSFFLLNFGFRIFVCVEINIYSSSINFNAKFIKNLPLNFFFHFSLQNSRLNVFYFSFLVCSFILLLFFFTTTSTISTTTIWLLLRSK